MLLNARNQLDLRDVAWIVVKSTLSLLLAGCPLESTSIEPLHTFACRYDIVKVKVSGARGAAMRNIGKKKTRLEMVPRSFVGAIEQSDGRRHVQAGRLSSRHGSQRSDYQVHSRDRQ